MSPRLEQDSLQKKYFDSQSDDILKIMESVGLEEKNPIPGGEIAPSRHYQVNVQHVDVPSMIDKVIADLHWNKVLATIHAQRHLRRMRFVTPFSLRDIELKRFNNEIFDNVTGSVIINGDLPQSALGNFFTPDRIFKLNRKTELRGPNYYIGLDSEKKDPQQKLSIIKKDLTEGLNLLGQLSRQDLKTEDEFLLYLGLLDYLKIHALTIFHAVTYNERKGEFPQGVDYKDVRKEAQNLMIGLTRTFYQACLGQPYDAYFNSENMMDLSQNLITYLENNVSQNEYYRFPYPEINNPLVIMLGAQEAALRNPNIDTLVGIPSGGSETAVAAQLAYQYLGKKIPDIIFVPLSSHSLFNNKTPPDRLAEIIGRIYPGLIEGKAILMVDDNANTGTTIETMAEAIDILGAKSESLHLAQHDPGRIKNKYYQKGRRLFHYLFKADHKNYKTTMGLVILTKQKKELLKEAIFERLRASRN